MGLRQHGNRAGRRSFASELLCCGLTFGLLSCGSSPNATAPSPSAAESSSSPTPSTASASPLPEGVVASIAVSDTAVPTGLAAVRSSLWVVAHNGGTASRIDPTTNRVVHTVQIDQGSCGEPIEAFGDLLALPCADSASVVVVDGRSGKIRGTIRDAAGTAVAADGSVWVGTFDGKTLQRVDPKTLKREKTIRTASGLTAFDGHFVWSAGADEHGAATGALAKVDPGSNRVVQRYSLSPMGVTFMTYGFGALWFKPIDKPELIRFETATGRSKSIPLPGWSALSQFGDQPVAVGAGSLWVRSADDRIVRINPKTYRVEGRYVADPSGGGGYPLVAFGSLWVANYGSATVWRQPIRAKG
jgi:streptogramin lyase